MASNDFLCWLLIRITQELPKKKKKKNPKNKSHQISPGMRQNDSKIYMEIFKCKLNWALGSITMNKASELFQILKDAAVKMLNSICQQGWKISSGHRTGKDQFSFESQGKAVPKNAQTTSQLHSFHMLAK